MHCSLLALDTNDPPRIAAPRSKDLPLVKLVKALVELDINATRPDMDGRSCRHTWAEPLISAAQACHDTSSWVGLLPANVCAAAIAAMMRKVTLHMQASHQGCPCAFRLLE